MGGQDAGLIAGELASIVPELAHAVLDDGDGVGWAGSIFSEPTPPAGVQLGVVAAGEPVARVLGPGPVPPAAVQSSGMTLTFCPEGYYTPFAEPGTEPCHRPELAMMVGFPQTIAASWDAAGASLTLPVTAGRGDVARLRVLADFADERLDPPPRQAIGHAVTNHPPFPFALKWMAVSDALGFERMKIPTTSTAVLGATLALAFMSGCSEESKSEVASLIVCERAEDLQEAVGEVADNDLADAQEEIADLRSDFTSLSSRTETLGGSQRDSIEALIPDAETAIAALESATDIAGIQTALDSGSASLEALASAVDSTLDCDD